MEGTNDVASRSGLPLASLSLAAHLPQASNAGFAKRAVRPTSAVVPHHVSKRTLSTTAIVEASAQQTINIAAGQGRQANSFVKALTGVVNGLGRLLMRPQSAVLIPGVLAGARVFPSLLARQAPPSTGRPAGAGGGRKPILVWLRADLRLHDHEAFAAACKDGSSLMPVYVFDPREYGQSPTGFDKTGPHRARFILDALSDLRSRLQAAGAQLLLRRGPPERVLAQLAAQVGAGAVYYHAEVTPEEMQVEWRVKAALQRVGVEARAFWSGTLHHVEDLPFKLQDMPSNFSDFKSRMTSARVRPTTEQPAQLKGLPLEGVDVGTLPSLQDLGFSTSSIASLDNMPLQHTSYAKHGSRGSSSALRGGEGEALRQLDLFVTELKASLQLRSAHTSSSASPSPTSSSSASAASAFSCRISPWLALGCLSPRHMYHVLSSKLGAQGSADLRAAMAPTPAARAVPGAAAGPASWLMFELLWRDFFRLVTNKHSSATSSKQQPMAARPSAPAHAATMPALAVA